MLKVACVCVCVRMNFPVVTESHNLVSPSCVVLTVNGVFISFFLYMKILIANIHCTFVIIYMHYHGNYGLTEHVLWYLVKYFAITRSSETLGFVLQPVCKVNYPFVRGAAPPPFFLQVFVPGGVKLDIYCSTLCTVTGHCTAVGLFAEYI